MSASGAARDEDGLTPSQRRFVHLLLETGNPGRAYAEAHPKTEMTGMQSRAMSAKLLKSPAVRAAIVKARRTAQEKHEVTLEFLTDKVLTALSLAEQVIDPKAMVTAAAQLSKMYGFDASPRQNERSALTEALELFRQRREAEKGNGAVH